MRTSCTDEASERKARILHQPRFRGDVEVLYKLCYYCCAALRMVMLCGDVLLCHKCIYPGLVHCSECIPIND